MIDNEYHKKESTKWSKKDTIHYVALSFYIIMDVNSYLDEYDNFFESGAETEFKPRIRIVKKIAKPVVDRLRKWKDIKNFRNQIIAHPWRINGSEFSLKNLGLYNTPRTFHDLLYLQTYLEIVQTVINAEFEEESKHVNQYISSLKNNSNTPPVANPNFESEIRTLVQEINERCKKESRIYYIDEEAIFIL